MAATPIIPRAPAELCEWFNNFIAGFPAASVALGFSTEEKDTVIAEAGWVVYACRMSADATGLSQAWTDWRDRLLDEPAAPEAGPVPTTAAPAAPAGLPPAPGVLSRFRAYIRRIKAAPNYTSSIGESLRLVVASSPVDDASAKPALTAEPLANFKAKVVPLTAASSLSPRRSTGPRVDRCGCRSRGNSPPRACRAARSGVHPQTRRKSLRPARSSPPRLRDAPAR